LAKVLYCKIVIFWHIEVPTC